MNKKLLSVGLATTIIIGVGAPTITNAQVIENKPNQDWNLVDNIYDYTLVPSNELHDTTWGSLEDKRNVFAIEGGSNKGVLSFEVRYPQEEFDHWKNLNIDRYLTYRVYAEKKDGSFESVYKDGTIGMPSTVYSKSVNVDNPDYTGKFALILTNSQTINLNYQFKMSFTPTATEEKPEEPSTGGNTDNGGDTNNGGDNGEVTPPVVVEEVQRFSGIDRYATSRSLSSKIKSGSLDTVILTSGSDFPDALTGGVLNNSKNATVMLVSDKDSVIDGAIKESKRLLKSGGKVVILGGTVAVSKKVESAFKSQVGVVERISGNDRYETASIIANYANSKPQEAFIASGLDFADALSIVPYASKSNIPVLLTRKDSVPATAINYLKEKGIKKVTLIGGTVAVSSNVEKQLSNLGIKVERISGATRYETSLTIAKKYFPNARKVGVASGTNYPDALSGSRFALDNDMPIVLTQPTAFKSVVKTYVEDKDSVYFFGGNQVISDALVNSVKK